MTGLWFSDPHALRAVLPLVPISVQAAGGRVVREPDGSLVVLAEVPDKLKKELVKAGAKASKVSGGAPFVHWAELVPLEVDPEPLLREVLFCLPAGAPWLPLAAELVRLGCDRVELAGLDRGDWVLRVGKPPYYTIAKAGAETWSVYARQGAAWVEAGYTHPFAARLLLPATEMGEPLVLIGREGWRLLATPVFTELATLIDLEVAAVNVAIAAPPTERLTVRLRLEAGPRTGRPVLWSVPDPVDERLNALVRDLPDTVTDRLTFARFTDAAGVAGALVRARPGSEPPTLEGLVPYQPHRELSTVFVPHGRAIAPPLRGRTLSPHLDPGLGNVCWLVPQEGGDGFVVRRIDEDAFQPLADHIVYQAEGNAEAVNAWMGSTLFDWEPLDLPVHGDPERERTKRGRAAPREEAVRPETPAPAPARRERAARPAVVTPLVSLDLSGTTVPEAGEIDRQLFELQQALLAAPDGDEPMPPEQAEVWVAMAERHHLQGAHREAALCWTRALWDAPSEDRTALAARWASRVALPDPLPEQGTAADCAAIVAHLLAGKLSGKAPGPIVLQRYFDAHDRSVDPRTRWLGRRAIAEASGNDVLALARAKDLVFQSIRRGLVPARDVPAFLRTSASPDELRLLGLSLAALPGRLEKHIPKGKDAAPVACSRAYARLTVAWAEASLGRSEPVAVALEEAAAALPKGDAVHQVLLGLYRSGIDEALQGLPAETPPPPEVLAALEALPRFDRYKVERLREQSVAVLTQTGARNAFDAFLAEDRPRLAVEADPLAAIREALAGTIDAATLLSVLDAATGLEEAACAEVLDAVIDRSQQLKGLGQAQVLVEVVSVAAMLRRPAAAEPVLGALEAALVEAVRSKPEEVVAPIRGLVRSLARCDLDAQATALLEAVHDATPPDRWVERLRLTAARAQVGGDVGNAIEQTLGHLATALAPNQTIAVVSATADLAAALPVADAVRLWERLVPFAALTDPYSTNTHFALSFLQVVEVLAAAHVHPDRLLGPAGRARLDADEHRIRLRIHREDRF